MNMKQGKIWVWGEFAYYLFFMLVVGGLARKKLVS